VGAGNPEATISVIHVVLPTATLVGSFGSAKEDVIAVYELLDSGQLDPLITTIGFAEIGSGLEWLRRGEVRGRLVAVRDWQQARTGARDAAPFGGCPRSLSI
jgi:alcohol dehydrogenase, propanol-preferring